MYMMCSMLYITLHIYNAILYCASYLRGAGWPFIRPFCACCRQSPRESLVDQLKTLKLIQ